MKEQDDLITTALRDLADQAVPPRLSTEALWRSGRRRRLAAITSAAGAAAAVALVPLAVLGGPSRPAPAFRPASSPAKHRPAPIELQQVASFTHHQCLPHSRGLPGTSPNECFYLSHTGMSVTKFASMTIANPAPGTYVLNVLVEQADIRPFANLTLKLANSPSPRNQLAIIANQEVLSHPTVVMQLNHGVFQIPAGPTRAQAQHLLHLLEHR